MILEPFFLGPEFWGLVNWEWKVCSKGQHQSPINIDPKLLLFDPQLKPLYVDKVRVRSLIPPYDPRARLQWSALGYRLSGEYWTVPYDDRG